MINTSYIHYLLHLLSVHYIYRQFIAVHRRSSKITACFFQNSTKIITDKTFHISSQFGRKAVDKLGVCRYDVCLNYSCWSNPVRHLPSYRSNCLVKDEIVQPSKTHQCCRCHSLHHINGCLLRQLDNLLHCRDTPAVSSSCTGRDHGCRILHIIAQSLHRSTAVCLLSERFPEHFDCLVQM